MPSSRPEVRADATAMPRRGRLVRWLPTATMMGMSWLSYMDRNVLALLAPSILKDVGLSGEHYGWIVSAFSVAYLVGNPTWGRLLDRFGVRAGALVAVGIWSLASTAHAFAYGVFGFAAARACLGFGEGATFPSGLRTATQTLEPGERSRGVAFAYSGGSLGAIAAPLLITPVALAYGWRGAFVATGALGLVWLVLWALVARAPSLGAPAAEVATSAPPSLRDRSVLSFVVAYAFGAIPLGFILYGAPLHLGRGLGLTQAQLGKVLWVPPLGWEVGYFFWGALVDRATQRGVWRAGTFDRFVPFLVVLSLPLVGAGFVTSLPLLLVLLFFAMFVASGFVILSLSEVTRRHGAGHGAYLAGLGAGSWSGLMAFVMPLFGALFDRSAYRTAYLVATLGPLVAFVLCRVLRDRSRDAVRT